MLLRALDGWRLTLLVVLALAVTRWAMEAISDDPEISLMINEPWEDMRQRSSAAISSVPPGEIWINMPESDACLRFNDPEYGFVTPLARFFSITFKNERVLSVRMSPQIEPLLLDDALKVVLDLQDQWREKGWVAMGLRNNPTIADTPEWRAWLRKGIRNGRSFWQAGDKYQVMLLLGRFKDSRNPTEERYLISLALAEPWVPFDEIEAGWESPSE
jgi:hypothetical protein